MTGGLRVEHRRLGETATASASAQLSTPPPTFASMFVTEYPKMVALAAGVAGERTYAEDIAQEAMSRLHDHWDRIRTYDKPDAWLRRVTVNLALSQRRKRANELKALLRLDRPQPQLPEMDEPDRELWRHVAELPKMQRAVIALQYLEDLKPAEIAEILEVEPATVRVHQHRARQRLLQTLGPDRGEGAQR